MSPVAPKMETYEALTFKLASKIENLSQTKWNKLMFLLDGVGVCNTDDTFTGFEYIRLPYGPVPCDYREKIRSMIFKGIVKKERYIGVTDSVMYIDPVDDNTKQEEASHLIKAKTPLEKALEKIVEIFGSWTAVRLSDFTHRTGHMEKILKCTLRSICLY